MKKRVFISNLIPAAAYQKLSKRFQVTWNKHQLTEKQLITLIAPYHAILTTLADPITANVLNAAPNLKCVANFAVGYNNIDLAGCLRVKSLCEPPDLKVGALCFC